MRGEIVSTPLAVAAGIAVSDLRLDMSELDAWLRKLGRPWPSFASELKEYSDQVVQTVETYPPPPPVDERTGRLGRSWSSSVKAAEALIKNVALYSNYVQGERQVWFHTMRHWLTVQTAMLQFLPGLQRAIQRKVRRIVEP